jgi:alpha-methylacyl-CoA racemase
MAGPLAGIRTVEFIGLGPVPHAAMLLADLGADVVRVEQPGGGRATVLVPPARDPLSRGRRPVLADLTDPAQHSGVLELIDRADVLLEGFRTETIERLGLGPEVCLARNPRLVYGRVAGWPRGGPDGGRAGHDINYLASNGILSAVGRADQPPKAPITLAADTGGGSMFVALGVLSALVERSASGRGQVVDAAMSSGSSLLIAAIWGLREHGLWEGERGTNLLDTGAPFYDSYRCADGGYLAVGALEPHFDARFVGGLGLDPAELPPQNDRETWPRLRRVFAERIARRTRHEWAEHLDSLDACVTPVLDREEAIARSDAAGDGAWIDLDGVRQPAPAPVFDRSIPEPPFPAIEIDLDEALARWNGAEA